MEALIADCLPGLKDNQPALHRLAQSLLPDGFHRHNAKPRDALRLLKAPPPQINQPDNRPGVGQGRENFRFFRGGGAASFGGGT